MFTKAAQSEKQICDSIIEYLNYHGCYCWRVNSGAIRATNKYGKQHLVRLAQAGTSDILGIRKSDGRMICIEVKKPETRRTVTQLQQTFLDKMSGYGAITGVATTPEEALAILKQAN